MLLRKGETPDFAIIAVYEDPTEETEEVLVELETALLHHLKPKQIRFIYRTEVELTSGQVIELHEKKILFSLAYPTAPGRIFEIELGAPEHATLH
jgi:hypothetical protein